MKLKNRLLITLSTISFISAVTYININNQQTEIPSESLAVQKPITLTSHTNIANQKPKVIMGGTPIQSIEDNTSEKVDLSSVNQALPEYPEYEGDPILLDAEAYAEEFKISESEALRRMYIQDRLGPIEQTIHEANPESFAGLWIEHEPEYRIVVQTTLEDTSSIPKHLEALIYDVPIEVVTVDKPLHELEASLAKISQTLFEAEIEADLNIDVINNRPEVMVTNVENFQKSLEESDITLPDNTHIKEVEELAFPAVDIEAGRGLFNCTSGFVVYSVWKAEYGVSTAGHCGNNQTYAGSGYVALTFEAQQYYGNADLQWHSATFNSSSNNFTNKVWDGTWSRSIWSIKPRNNQVIGSWVQRYGNTSGSAWGTIQTKYYRPNVNPGIHFQHTFMKASFSASPGDSGGPVFNSSSAYGIMMTSNGVYTAVDYLSNLGLQVKSW